MRRFLLTVAGVVAIVVGGVTSSLILPSLALSPAQVNGCQYLVSPPTLSDQQTSVIQCDSSGKILTNVTGGGTALTVDIDQTTPGTTNGVSVNQISGTTVATPAVGVAAGTMPVAADANAPDVLALGTQASAVCGTNTGTCSLIQLTKKLNSNIAAATVTAGQTTMSASVPVTMASDQAWATTYFLQPAASDNHTNIKNGAGTVHHIMVFNNSSTVNYLRFYNAASGFNGCNSATNLVSQIEIPASTTVGGVNIDLPTGMPFSTGISICVTSGYATTDTTNATASAMALTVGYN